MLTYKHKQHSKNDWRRAGFVIVFIKLARNAKPKWTNMNLNKVKIYFKINNALHANMQTNRTGMKMHILHTYSSTGMLYYNILKIIHCNMLDVVSFQKLDLKYLGLSYRANWENDP